MNPKPDRFMPALYGGLVIAGISAVPGLNLINCLCCAGIMLGGFLAVFFYSQKLIPGTEPLTQNDCLRLGIMAGIIAAIANLFIGILVQLVFGNIAVEMFLKMIYKMGLEIPAELQSDLDEALQQGVTFLGTLFSFVINLIIYTLFSLLGGLFGWSVFRRTSV